MGFLVLSTWGAAVCTVAKILKVANEAGEICGRGGVLHCVTPDKNITYHMIFKYLSVFIFI